MMLRKKVILSEARIWQHVLVEWAESPACHLCVISPTPAGAKDHKLMVLSRGLGRP